MFLIIFLSIGHSQAHVYSEGNDVYDVMLNQVGIKKKNYPRDKFSRE